MAAIGTNTALSASFSKGTKNWYPEDLAVESITGGVRISWTHSTKEGSITELWFKVNNGNWSILGCFVEGEESYDDIRTSEVDLNMQYKVRSFVHGDICINCTVASDALSKNIMLSVYSNSTQAYLSWGDGTKDPVSLLNGMNLYSHTYSQAGSYVITVIHAEVLDEFRIGDDNGSIPYFAGYYLTKGMSFLLDELNDAYRLLKVGIWGDPTIDYYGSSDGLSKDLILAYLLPTKCHYTGDFSLFTKMQVFSITGNFHGDCSSMLSLQGAFFNGEVTCTLDITNIDTITHLDSYGGNSFIGGDVTGKNSLKQICIGTPNELYGEITSPVFEYLDNVGGSHMTGDITNKTNIWKFRSYNSSNSFTGSIANLTALAMFMTVNDNSNVTKPTTITNNKALVQFQSDTWTFTSAEVNQILADLYADRNSASKVFPTEVRYFNLALANSEPPTGQGITDLLNLLNYKSPTPPGTALNWTIYTNLALGSELLTSVQNHSGYPFETFTANGLVISSAINSSGGCSFYSNDIGAVSIGDKFLLKCTHVKNSGTYGQIYIGAGAGLSARCVTGSMGVYSTFYVILEMTGANAGNNFVYEGGNAVDFSISELSLKKLI